MTHKARETSRYPMTVRSIFISSRMEELAIERRAAFNAVYESNLIPLLFETEPPESELKSQLDNLVDRGDIFVGLYYKSFGKELDQLFGMTPVEYEFFRFLELWKVRYEYDDRWGSHQGSQHERKTHWPRDAERECVDAALKKLSHKGLRRAFLKGLHEVAEIGDAEFAKKGPSLAADMNYYRAILRARVCFFVRMDGDDYALSKDLSALIGAYESFIVEPFRATPFNAEIGQPSAQRFAEPHVVLYEVMKKRLRMAIKDGILRLAPPTPISEPRRRDAFAVDLIVRDQLGLLEDMLDVFFTYGLNISLLSMRTQGDGWSRLLFVAAPFEKQASEAAGNLKEEVRLALCRSLGGLSAQQAYTPPSESRASDVVKESRRSDARRSDISRGLLREINLLSRWPTTRKVADRLLDSQTDGPASLAQSYSYRIQGADVPGMFLSIARVIKQCRGNITRISFGSDSEAAPGGRDAFLSFGYFAGDICVEFREDGVGTTLHERILDLRYKLLNLLGVQAIRVIPPHRLHAAIGGSPARLRKRVPIAVKEIPRLLSPVSKKRGPSAPSRPRQGKSGISRNRLA